jgi:hypothetical protein
MISGLHPRLAELCTELDRTRDALLAAIERAPPSAVSTVPAPGAWSIAEIVEHLQIVEDGIGRALGKLAKQADVLGPETDATSVLSRLDRFGLRDPKRPIKAPPSVSPTGAASLQESIAGLAASRARLLEMLSRVSGRALGEITAPHPLMGRLDFYQWLLFLAQHEERHSIQIQETAERLSNASAVARS